jgi:hypothetical protein
VTEENLYTLEEARQKIMAEVCLRIHGEHDIRQIVATTFMGIRYLFVVECKRCGLELVPRQPKT